MQNAAITFQLLLRVPRILQEPPIGELELTRRGEGRHQPVDGIEREAKVFFACAERILGAFSLDSLSDPASNEGKAFQCTLRERLAGKHPDDPGRLKGKPIPAEVIARFEEK